MPWTKRRFWPFPVVSECGERVNFLRDETAGEDLAAKKWTVYAATQQNTGQMVKRAAPGGEGLVFNHFSKEATLHYLERFQSAMKGKNPGIRSLFNDSYELSRASSTSDLFEAFQSRKGYDLALYLQELSGQGEPELTGRIKSDYREVTRGFAPGELHRKLDLLGAPLWNPDQKSGARISG